MNVCPECFQNETLKRRLVEIRPRFPSSEKCRFHPTLKAVPLGEVGAIVDPAFRANYGFGRWMFDQEEGDDLRFIIQDMTGATEEAVVDSLVDWLVENDSYWPPDGEEAFYATDRNYVPIPLDGWRHSILWERFREAILHRQRFFNDRAKGFLDEIFDGIQHQADVSGRPTFYRTAPEDGTILYRARVVADEAAFRQISENPSGQMGTPPPALRRQGRMNAAGIPVFYGATERDTAVAELRPAVGARIAVAAFRSRRPLHVLDLTRFDRPGKRLDILSKNHAKRTTQWAFMQSFALEISKPILPGDEHLEYVPPQVVAEYLTSQPIRWRGNEVTPDAVMFRSAQRDGGRNIAIMGDAAKVLGATSAGGEHGDNRPAESDDLDYLDFVSPLTPRDNPGLEYVDGSIELVTVRSATYSIAVQNVLSDDVLSLPDVDEDRF
ncbi:RES family NAD+ phosphorylase [Aureimonas sp. AU22]|uniref:RES family NAD+ phosphorylase n=1 Tax=Aureimonas sp. AU22 TaxID=1638162 RepID=UPI000782B19A|nr:RES family NAD+ phosphorylase [Aureimonas sp. AU22]